MTRAKYNNGDVIITEGISLADGYSIETVGVKSWGIVQGSKTYPIIYYPVADEFLEGYYAALILLNHPPKVTGKIERVFKVLYA